MNSVISVHHTYGCVASPWLCGLSLSKGQRSVPREAGTTTRYNIGEANFTGVSRLTLTGPFSGGGETPHQDTQHRMQPSLAFHSAPQTALLGACVRPRRPRDYAGSGEIHLPSVVF